MTTASALTYVLTCSVAAIAAAAVGLAIWNRRDVQGARALALVMLLVCSWCVSAALETLTVNFGLKLFWAKAEYIGITLSPLALLVFVTRYTGRDGWLRRPQLALLAVIPVLTLLLDWTDELHGLIHSHRALIHGQIFDTWQVTYGPLFWVDATYQYVLLGAAFVFGCLGLFGRGPAFRGQAIWLVVGLAAPWAANLAFISGVEAVPRLDFTPPALAVTGFAVTSTLLGAHLLDLVPIAHRAVLESMSAAVVVIDRHGRIQDLNPAAMRLLGRAGHITKGQLARDVLAGLPTVPELGLDSPSSSRDVRIMDTAEECVFEVLNTPIRRGEGPPLGRLLLINDVTERVRAEEERVRLVAERTARKQAEAGRRKAALLADISTSLAHPLDLDSILTRLQKSIVPGFADGMVLELLEHSGLGEHCIVAHASEEGAALLKQAYPLHVHAALTGTPSAFAEAVDHNAVEPLLIEDACPETLIALGGDASHLKAWQALKARSVIRVPLSVGDRLVGIFVLVVIDCDRRFDGADLVFAEDLAERCALAFDNARLYRTARQEIAERMRAEALLERRALQRQALADFEHTALKGADIPLLLPEAVRLVADVIGANCVAIVERTGGPSLPLRVVASKGWRDQALDSADAASGVVAGVHTSAADQFILIDWQDRPGEQRPSVLIEQQVCMSAVFPIVLPGQQSPAAWLAVHNAQPAHFSRFDLAMIQSIAQILGVAMERKRAEAAIHRFARRSATIQEEERRRVARELHDEIGQQLTGLHLLLGTVAANTPTVRPLLAEARVVIGDLLERVRNLSLELRPTVLDDLGLEAALRWLADRYTRLTGVAVRLSVDGKPGRLPNSIETAAYRIVQEALTNIARHSGAPSADVVVRVDRKTRRMFVEVVDAGCGFDTSSTTYGTETTGMAGMRERAEAAGGTLEVQSNPGTGTHVTAVFNLAVPQPLATRVLEEWPS